MALALNALTDYATVAAELGLNGGADQTLIERLIGAASSALEDYCRRKLVFQAGIIEPRPMQGGTQLLVDRTPLLVLGSAVTQFGQVQAANVRIHDAEVGSIWSDVGWPWSALIQSGRYDPNFTFDQTPGTEAKLATATYAGGYITGPQAAALVTGATAAAPWPGAAQAVDPGALCVPAGQQAQVWMATLTDPTVTTVLTTGGVEPTWPASPKRPRFPQSGSYCPIYGGSTIVDGSITWVFLGTPGAAGARGTAAPGDAQSWGLPASLEEACIVETKARYLERSTNANIKSEAVLGASATYDRTGGLCAAAMELAKPYRRSL